MEDQVRRDKGKRKGTFTQLVRELYNGNPTLWRNRRSAFEALLDEWGTVFDLDAAYYGFQHQGMRSVLEALLFQKFCDAAKRLQNPLMKQGELNDVPMVVESFNLLEAFSDPSTRDEALERLKTTIADRDNAQALALLRRMRRHEELMKGAKVWKLPDGSYHVVPAPEALEAPEEGEEDGSQDGEVDDTDV